MKFAIVLNRKADLAAQINGAGHLCLGLHRWISEQDMLLRTFTDATGAAVSVLTDHPLIVLSARNGAHLKEAHALALANDVICSAFFECMRTGTPADQEVLVKQSTMDAQEYVALALFGPADKLNPITRRFSLTRSSEAAASQ